MPTDLSYFYERDLNKGCFREFHNFLPEHLKEMFEASMGGFNCFNIDSTNVLQGYRGPHNNGSSGDSENLSAINGLQEVKYWWGASKTFFWIPIAGIIAFGIARAAGDTNWHSLYFDSKTGECLSHDKEIAASKLNETGRKLFESGKFVKAKEYFSNAYTHSNKKVNYDVYKKNENNAQSAIDKNNEADQLNEEGYELHHQGRYEEANAKFDQAYHKCTSGYSEEARFKKNRDMAKNNWAEELNKQGDRLWEQGNHSGAFEKYNQAYKKCTEGYENEQTFKSNRDKAQAAVDKNKQADLLDKEGIELHKQRKYEEAYVKLEQAYNKCTSGYSEEARFKRNRDIAKNNWAGEINKQGNQFWEQKDYSKAVEMYNLAYNKCNDGYTNKEIFKSNKSKAQGELDAVSLKELGDREFEAGRYDSALVSYQQAYEISSVTNNKNTYKACINETKTKVRSSIITEFNLIIKQDSSEEKLTNLGIRLEKMIDEGGGSDREIVSRLHVISLRLARNKMKSQLQSVDQAHMSHLIEAIMNLLETEIEVLKILNITDERLEQELKSLEERLDALDPDNAEEKDENDEMLVNIATIAFRADEIFEQIENMTLERLGQTEQVLA